MNIGEKEDSTVEHHFIELATRTLENDPATRDETRAELASRLARERSRGKELPVEAALYQLAKFVPVRQGIGSILAGAVVILILAAIALLQVGATLPEIKLLPIAMNDNPSAQKWFDRLPAEDREFFAAGLGEGLFMLRLSDEVLQLESLDKLRQQHPADLGLFELYSFRHVGLHGDVPPGFRETWQKLDPGNGMWDLLEAASLAMGKTSGVKCSEQDRARAVQLFHQGASSGRFQTYLPELRERKLARLPEFPATYVGNAALANLASPLRIDFDELTYRQRALAVLVYTMSEELSKNQEKAGLRTLAEDWRKTSLGLLAASRNWEDLNANIYFVSFIEYLADSARNLGLTEEEKHLRALMAEIALETSPVPASFRAGSVLTLKSAVDPKQLDSISRQTARRYPLPLDITRQDAGRLAEYLAAERGFALLASILVLVALTLAWLESFRRGKRVNGMADGLAPLLQWRDTAWILGLGVIAPFLCYWTITRHTPLSARDIGMTFFTGFPPVLIQMISGLLLPGVLTLQIIQWRIKRRLGVLGLGGRSALAGWGVVIVTALILPAAGAIHWLPVHEDPISKGIAAACGIPLLWMLWQGGSVLFSPTSGALGGVLLCRTIATPLALACLILLRCGPTLRSIEESRMIQASITNLNLSEVGTLPGEARAVADLTKRITTILEANKLPDP
ncbi:hypothetical protein OJ996_03205 [Luteolibacter sp. GHJ8]|uniref:Uncharacterized protein n=1 Tax=Luteolibacter rhizosphaerae TaxID=2989719 RepID=A0ABT3FYB5_9BACT|nr:hypothetical protein [Luteolibacter rhizosphaerae]MCW1912566.1 hypothetical protein [Luteolibacter rhizosphaerae]